MSQTEMNGIFAFCKPTGISSANAISKLQHLFQESNVFSSDLQILRQNALKEFQASNKSKGSSKRFLNKRCKIKVGHGGTLDVAASGVLVVGIGSGTKKLSAYLNECTKVYGTEAVLGASTTSGDFEGEILSYNSVDHISRDDILELESKFVGHLTQTPPIFSALKMNGKKLYEYAREGIPLPKSIKSREVTIHSLKIDKSSILSKDHSYKLRKPEVDDDGKPIASKLTGINDDDLHYSKEYVESQKDKEIVFPKPKPLDASQEELILKDDYVPPLLKFTAKVSSGTYIRSLVSDMGKALDSSAYMVALTRQCQGAWDLSKNVFVLENFENYHEDVWGEVLSKVFKEGPDINVQQELETINRKFLEKNPELEGKKYSLTRDHQKRELSNDEPKENGLERENKKQKGEDLIQTAKVVT